MLKKVRVPNFSFSDENLVGTSFMETIAMLETYANKLMYNLFYLATHNQFVIYLIYPSIH